MTEIQKKILELMKDGEPLQKYGRVCHVDGVEFNANSVKSLINNGTLEFYAHDNANGWDFYKLATPVGIQGAGIVANRCANCNEMSDQNGDCKCTKIFPSVGIQNTEAEAKAKELLYRKLHALRLEVHSSIVDDITKTVDACFASSLLPTSTDAVEFAEVEEILIPFIKAARHTRNFPHPEIPVELIRSEATQAEQTAERILGNEKYQAISNKAL